MALLGIGSTAWGQSSDPPNDAPFQAGPLVLAPVVRLTNAGHDSNVFNSSEDPKSDITATLSPSMEAWFRMAHGRANGRSQFDLYYFKTLTDLRAIDSDNSAHIEIPVNRLMPYATGGIVNTRHRQNLEIDALARRRMSTLLAGTDVRLTAKATAGLFATRTDLHYDQNSLFLNTDLARVLNYRSTGEGANLRYAVTPFTAITLEAVRTDDRFESVSDRNSNTVRVASGVSFSPRALISGNAAIGVQKRHFLHSATPAAAGTFVAANLSYALLGRTRFTVNARRDLEYSYLIGQTDYVNSGLTLFVTQRVGDSWDVGGSVGRYRLLYRADPSVPDVRSLFSTSDETVVLSSGDIAYNLGHTKIGVQVEYRRRLADQPFVSRGYRRLRIGSTVTYAF